MEKFEFPKRCFFCKYYLKLRDGDYICDYINKEDEPRGCLIDDNCKRFKPRQKVVLKNKEESKNK